MQKLSFMLFSLISLNSFRVVWTGVLSSWTVSATVTRDLSFWCREARGLCVKLLGWGLLIGRARGFPLSQVIAALVLLPHAVDQEEDEEDGEQEADHAACNNSCGRNGTVTRMTSSQSVTSGLVTAATTHVNPNAAAQHRIGADASNAAKPNANQCRSFTSVLHWNLSKSCPGGCIKSEAFQPLTRCPNVADWTWSLVQFRTVDWGLTGRHWCYRAFCLTAGWINPVRTNKQQAVQHGGR